MTTRLSRLAKRDTRTVALISGWGVQIRERGARTPWGLPSDPGLRGAPVLRSRAAARFQAEYLRTLGWQTRIVSLTGLLTVRPAK